MSNITLITITAPSCGGKSFLFNYIRDVAKLPCLISTTTRSPRANELDGVDYFFISEEQSLQMEKDNQFAELAIYRGVRYGVTKEEFSKKLNPNSPIAFLICEPSGINHYAKPALDIGAKHFKIFIDTPWETRFDRFKQRISLDLAKSFADYLDKISNHPYLKFKSDIIPHEDSHKVVQAGLDRLSSMLTIENTWVNLADWDLILNGIHSPEHNLRILSENLVGHNLVKIEDGSFIDKDAQQTY